MDAKPTRLLSRTQGDVRVVHFADTKVIDQRNINQIGAELMEMVETGGVLKMLINMSNVRYLSSAVLGKLISLHKALRTRTGILKLCNVGDPIYEVFEITRLNQVFDMYDSEDKALEAFRLRQ
jgi:anti-sigma B factor antagonist